MPDTSAETVNQMMLDLEGLGVQFQHPRPGQSVPTVGQIARRPDGVMVIGINFATMTLGEIRQCLTYGHLVVRGEVDVPPGCHALLEA